MGSLCSEFLYVKNVLIVHGEWVNLLLAKGNKSLELTTNLNRMKIHLSLEWVWVRNVWPETWGCLWRIWLGLEEMNFRRSYRHASEKRSSGFHQKWLDCIIHEKIKRMKCTVNNAKGFARQQVRKLVCIIILIGAFGTNSKCAEYKLFKETLHRLIAMHYTPSTLEQKYITFLKKIE